MLTRRHWNPPPGTTCPTFGGMGDPQGGPTSQSSPELLPEWLLSTSVSPRIPSWRFRVRVMNWHCHVLFALFFSTLTILIFQDLIFSTSPHSFQTISSAHFAQQINKNVCIKSHKIADTTFILQWATRFKTK